MNYLRLIGAVMLAAGPALADGHSVYSVSELTAHTLTNAQLLRLWLDVPITITGQQNEKGFISIDGSKFTL